MSPSFLYDPGFRGISNRAIQTNTSNDAQSLDKDRLPFSVQIDHF